MLGLRRRESNFELMITLLNLLILCALAWIATRSLSIKLGPVVYWGLVARLLGATALGFVYIQFWGGGDTLALFNAIVHHNEAHAISLKAYFEGLLAPLDLFSGNPRSVFFTRVMSPFGLLTSHSYWLMAGYLAVFSFWCTWRLISVLMSRYPDAKWALIIGLGFLPSFIFWSSGLLKDTLANASCYYIVSYVLSSYWNKRLPIGSGVLSIALFMILIFTRHYLAGMMTLTLSMIVIGDSIVHRPVLVRILVLSMVFVLVSMSFRYIFIRLRPERLPLTVYELNEVIKAKSDPNTTINLSLTPTWTSLTLSAPVALATGLFRPWVWESRTFFMALQALENTVVFFLLTLTMWRVRHAQWDMAIFGAILFVTIMATLLTLTTPNFGSLSRYKAGYSAIFFVLVAILPARWYFENKRQIT